MTLSLFFNNRSPAARRRRDLEETKMRYQNLLRNEGSELNSRISTQSQKSYNETLQNIDPNNYLTVMNGGSILVSMYNNTNRGSLSLQSG